MELLTLAFTDWIGHILSTKGIHIAIDGKALRAATEKIIENGLHYVLDENFLEDKCTAKKSQNTLSVLRKTAYNIIWLMQIDEPKGRAQVIDVIDEIADDVFVVTRWIFEPIPSFYLNSILIFFKAKRNKGALCTFSVMSIIIDDKGTHYNLYNIAYS